MAEKTYQSDELGHVTVPDDGEWVCRFCKRPQTGEPACYGMNLMPMCDECTYGWRRARLPDEMEG